MKTPDLREMLQNKDAKGLSDFCETTHPASVANSLTQLKVTQTWEVLSYTSPARQAAIVHYLPPDKKLAMVLAADRNRLASLLEVMAPDDRVDLLKEVEPELLEEELLPLVDQAQREDIRRLLSYPKDSAGSVMTTDYAWVPEGLTAGEALGRLRHQAPSGQRMYYVYVLDGERHLRGVVTLPQLILRPASSKLSEFMKRDVISVQVDMNKEDAARRLAELDLIALPVVDKDNRLVGLLTHDNVLDVVVEAATEDAHRMGAVGPMEENYLEAGFATVWRKRTFWLSCLFVAELFTFSALAYFEGAIEKVVALSLFVPLCISTGGNSGSQAATLITRAMALGQVAIGDWLRVLRHELLMGLALGCTLGAIGFLRASMTPQSVLGGADRWTVALVISQAVTAICLWGTLVGSMLPLIFRRLGVDPAVASSPFVATFVDVTGIIIYFSIATVYLL